ncbi:putative glycosidase CRH2 [Dimargaris xerosporica]|nr:putative glycosidase CRH2 [Dimargaris xerosporica]
MKLPALLVAAGSVAPLVAAVCKEYGDICPQELPCCNYLGYCSNDVQSCRVNIPDLPDCQSEFSYSKDSCQPYLPCVDLKDDFTRNSLVSSLNFTGNPNRALWTSDFEPNRAAIRDNKLYLYIQKDDQKYNSERGFGARVTSVRLIDYGTVRFTMNVGRMGRGIVYSAIIKNKAGDEIDFEFLGATPNVIQTNYYWDGYFDPNKPGNMTTYELPQGTIQDTHVYEIQWEPTVIRWLVDGVLIRTLNKADTYDPAKQTYIYPYRPSNVQLSIWDGGNDPAEGTRNWAGSPTEWQSPDTTYDMYVDQIDISCFYKGNATKVDWPWDDMAKMTGSKKTSTQAAGGREVSVKASPLLPSGEAEGQRSTAGMVAPMAVVGVTVSAVALFGQWL